MQTVSKCGLYAGYRAHQNKKEVVCSPCKEAAASYYRSYAIKNANKIRLRNAEYRQENIEQRKAYDIQYVRSHKEQKRIYDSLHRVQNGGQNLQEILGQPARIPQVSKSLKAKYPTLALELVDTSEGQNLAERISSKAGIYAEWKCPTCREIWTASVDHRADGRGCPNCAQSGYNCLNVGWLYLLLGQRNGIDLVKYGISNNIVRRMARHSQNGFQIDNNALFLRFNDGDIAANIELKIKQELKKHLIPSVKNDQIINDKFDGYTEAFRKEILPVESLLEIINFLNIVVPSEGVRLLPYSYALNSRDTNRVKFSEYINKGDKINVI